MAETAVGRAAVHAPRATDLAPLSPAEPGPRSPVPGPRSSHPDGWRPGLKVRHASFGSGVILQVQGTAAQTRLVVFFERAGRKVLIPALAKVEKA